MWVLLFTDMQHCWSCAKHIIWKMLLMNAVGLGLNCLHKDCHCTPKAAGSVQGCVFVSWHSRVPYMHSHTHGMNLCIILSCLLHPCCTAAFWFLHTQKEISSSQLRDKCSQKEGGRQIAKRKGEQKGKWHLVWHEKKEGALQPEWGVHLICNYPPDDQPVFEVDWLPGVCWERKF